MAKTSVVLKWTTNQHTDFRESPILHCPQIATAGDDHLHAFACDRALTEESPGYTPIADRGGKMAV